MTELLDDGFKSFTLSVVCPPCVPTLPTVEEIWALREQGDVDQLRCVVQMAMEHVRLLPPRRDEFMISLQEDHGTNGAWFTEHDHRWVVYRDLDWEELRCFVCHRSSERMRHGRMLVYMAAIYALFDIHNAPVDAAIEEALDHSDPAAWEALPGHPVICGTTGDVVGHDGEDSEYYWKKQGPPPWAPQKQEAQEAHETQEAHEAQEARETRTWHN